MRVRGLWTVAGFVVATAGCASILGDFEQGAGDATAGGGADATADAPQDAPSADVATIDRTLPADSGGDTTIGDAKTDGGDGASDRGPIPDAACAVGLSRCAAGCVALDAATACGTCGNDCTSLAAANVVASSIGCTGGQCSYACAAGYGDCSDSGTGCAINLGDAAANCGQCGHGCNRGACTAGACGAYVVAQQPTTGTVAKLATDGTSVLWSDTGIVAIKQIAAAGGTAIVLAATSSTNGGVSAELALAGTTVAFTYLGTAAPSVGLAKLGLADSGTSAFPGALAVNAVSLNAAATHLFFVNVTGTQGSLNDCLVNGLDAGACVGVVGGGRFVGQTAADNGYLFFDLTGANTLQAGLYIDVISTNTANIFTTEMAQSLAVDGTWAYWTVPNDGGPTYSMRRTLESGPGSVIQTVAGNLGSKAFATDGANVYYWTGSAVAAKPVAGGTEVSLAPASSFVDVAVSRGLLVWTDGTTIWGLVLPAH